MKKISLWFLLALATTTSMAANRPNIVLIMADDLGLGDVSHHVRTQMGKEPLFETPALDALAEQSLWFTDGHSATALCSPTRYCVMSGNNNYRSYAPWGVWGTFRPTAFKPGEVTLGTVVRDANYATGFIGKWHLGGDFLDPNGNPYRGTDRHDISGHVDMTKLVAFGPKDFGFDYDFTLPCGIQGPIYMAYENQEWYPLGKESKVIYFNEQTAKFPKDVSDKGPGMGDSEWNASEMGKIISAKAVAFINEKAPKITNGDKPFFLYYCSPNPHKPHTPPVEFDGKKILNSTPSRHLDMVVDFDCQVARIVKALKDNNVYDNTLLVIMSDNGGLLIDQDTVKSGHKSSGFFAGAKNSPFEGGHRTPFFAVWPGVIKPGVTHQPAINTDFVSTFAALVGTEIPEGQAVDSNNILPLFTGEGAYKERTYMLQFAGSGKEVLIRQGEWKLIMQSDNKLSKFEPKGLYNLAENPYEKWDGNFVKDPAHQDRVKAMRTEYLRILQSGERTAP